MFLQVLRSKLVFHGVSAQPFRQRLFSKSLARMMQDFERSRGIFTTLIGFV